MNNRNDGFDDDIYRPDESRRTKHTSKKSKSTEQDGSYKVSSVDMSDKIDKKSALREMQIQQNNCIANYKEWANSTLNYKSLSDLSDSERTDVLSQRIKASNDAYTVGLITSSLSPLQNGVDGKSILQTMLSYKATQALNPSMDMDVSRMFMNFRNAIAPMVENHKVLSKLISPIDDMVMKSSINRENNAISESLKSNSIDSLVMTPRQLAAIKMNFMEQYYVDTRTLDPTSNTYENDLDDLSKMYDTSLQHIRAIAENSGYDMSVVASEERYLVGLKMLNEPDSCYEDMFEETCSIYGVCPNLAGDNDEAIWQGDFKSSDGHVYSANRDDYNGSFTVRKPITEKDLPDFKESLCRQGQQYAWMQQYLKSDACPADKMVKSKALNILNNRYENYKHRISVVLQDDLNMSEKQADSVIRETFIDSMNSELKINKDEAFTKIDDPFARSKTENVPGSDFFRELRYVEEKKIYNNLGVDVAAKDYKTRNAVLERIGKNAKAYYELKGEPDDRELDNIAIDMVDNDVENFTAEELADFMLHVGTNMEQGWQKRGSYDRYADESFSDEADTSYDNDKKENVKPDFSFDVDKAVQEYIPEIEIDVEDDMSVN